jgi:hypothetical protein
MPSITHQGQEHFKKLASRNNLPPWWPIFSALIIVCAALFLLYSIFFSSSTSLSIPTTTSPTVTISASTQTTISPPQNLPQIASQAALFLFTAQGAHIPWAIPVPTVTQLFPSATVTSTQDVSHTPSSVTYQVTINPGVAGTSVRYISVTLTKTGGSWSVSNDS